MQNEQQFQCSRHQFFSMQQLEIPAWWPLAKASELGKSLARTLDNWPALRTVAKSEVRISLSRVSKLYPYLSSIAKGTRP